MGTSGYIRRKSRAGFPVRHLSSLESLPRVLMVIPGATSGSEPLLQFIKPCLYLRLVRLQQQ